MSGGVGQQRSRTPTGRGRRDVVANEAGLRALAEHIEVGETTTGNGHRSKDQVANEAGLRALAEDIGVHESRHEGGNGRGEFPSPMHRPRVLLPARQLLLAAFQENRDTCAFDAAQRAIALARARKPCVSQLPRPCRRPIRARVATASQSMIEAAPADPDAAANG